MLLASKPTSIFVPPLGQLRPVGSTVVFTRAVLPSFPLFPVKPCNPVCPCGPVAPATPCGPVAPWSDAKNCACVPVLPTSNQVW